MESAERRGRARDAVRRLGVPVVLAFAATAVVAWRAPAVPYLDGCTYYTAGLEARERGAVAAYDGEALRERHRGLHPGARRIGSYLYSPIYLLPSMALSTLPIDAAERLARRVCYIALGLGLLFVLLRLPTSGWRVAVAGAFAVAHPSWLQPIYLNWTFALFAFVAAAWWLGSRRRTVGAGIAWALAVLLKPIVGVGPLALAAARRVRSVGAVAIAVAALVLLSLPVVGASSWVRWAQVLRGAEAYGVTPYYNKVSLAATVARTESEPRDWLAPRGPVRSASVRGLFWVGLLVLAGGLVRLRDRVDAALAFALAWALLWTPQVWDHTEILLFLLLPAVAARWRGFLVAGLAATALYGPQVQELLRETLRGDRAPWALQLTLLLYPALNLLALASALAERPAGEATDEAVAAPA